MKWLLLLVPIALLSFFATAQINAPFPVITGDFKHSTVEQFLLQLEKQTGYRFFYDPQKLDSVSIDLSVKDQPLDKVLQLAFVNTSLVFSFDQKKHVFISKGMAVQTELASLLMDTIATPFPKEPARNIQPQYSPGNKIAPVILESKIYEIGNKNQVVKKGNITIAGYVHDRETGEAIIGASVYIDHPNIGVTTDQYGHYSISLPAGRYTMYIQSIGMRDSRRQVIVYGEGQLDIEMQTQVTTLKKVTVSAEKASNIKGLQMGIQKIDIKTIKQVPVVFGEPDLLRVILTLPGVKSVGEASTGLNVRGGSADQNLVLFNDATLYNPSHFFGMFSAFNPEVVKDVELYKSSIPAKYGGRLSSVLEINSREGNKKNFTGSAGIGLLTSRLNIEGPLVKDKSSFIIGGRTTYANWMLNLLPDQYKKSKASFYDLNLNISHEINKKNSLYLTGYLSNDRFNLNSDTTYSYGNKNISIKWKHVFSNKLYSLITGGYDRYQYNIASEVNPVNAYQLAFDINQTYFKAHFNYFASSKHTLEFGLNTLLYKLHPGSYQPVGQSSLVSPDEIPAEQALESALYVSDKYTISSTFSVEGGISYSIFNYLGPQNVNNYPPNVPKTTENIVSTTSYQGGQFIKTYQGPELRFSTRFTLTENSSLKAGYNSQRQYIHVLSNTTAIAPTDIWKLSDPNIKPQYGEQISLGFYKNFKSNTIETSIEVYYKKIKRLPGL